MKFIYNIILVTVLTGALALPSYGGIQDRVHPGNLVVWIFLGFCALIVLAQLVPVVRILLQKKSAANITAPVAHASAHREAIEQRDHN